MKIPALNPVAAQACVDCGHITFLKAEALAKELADAIRECTDEIEAGANAGMIQDQNECPAMCAEIWEIHGKAQAIVKDLHRYHKETVKVAKENNLNVPIGRGGGNR